MPGSSAFTPTVVAATWVGYDTPRNLGSRETGGGLSLPIWISYMSHALRNEPVQEYQAPAGVVRTGGDWYYEEYGPGMGVQAIGLDDPWPGMPNEQVPTGGFGELPMEPAAPAVRQEDRRSILDLFRN
jgi:penicillin-binding protein 1A